MKCLRTTTPAYPPPTQGDFPYGRPLSHTGPRERAAPSSAPDPDHDPDQRVPFRFVQGGSWRAAARRAFCAQAPEMQPVKLSPDGAIPGSPHLSPYGKSPQVGEHFSEKFFRHRIGDGSIRALCRRIYVSAASLEKYGTAVTRHLI